MIDLHVHTTASDGTLTPEQVVHLAKEKGFLAIGITDHDTVEGVEQAYSAGKKLNINVVCGIELSVSYDKADETHILGYFHRDDYKGIETYLEWIIKKRHERNHKLIDNLNKAGFKISADEVYEQSEGTPGRPHIASCLVSRGYARTINDAFEGILKRKDIYIRREKTSPKSAIASIIDKGGVPVLAHPVHIDKTESALLSALEEFISYGLMGIEAYHSDHSGEDTRKYIDIAKRYDLLITGGSDFHGDNKSEIQLGIPQVPDEFYYKLISAFKN